MSDERATYIECGTHGSKPWMMESMCTSCGRIYRPRIEDQSVFDGPFVEFERPEPSVCHCVCGELMLDYSQEPLSVGPCFARICPKCFKRDFNFARRNGLDVNDEKMRRDRLARRNAHHDN